MKYTSYHVSFVYFVFSFSLLDVGVHVDDYLNFQV